MSRLERYRAGMTPQQMEIADQRKCEQIEAALASLQTQLTQIEQAQADATAAAREAARINSYPNPGASILSASDGGTSATITIAPHVRVYPVQGIVDVPDVTLTNLPANITGLAYSTKYFVYYDDTTLANPAPAYLATTTAATAQVGAAAGRHCIGFVTTPASGGSATTGSGGGTPGGTGGGGSGGLSIE